MGQAAGTAINTKITRPAGGQMHYLMLDTALTIGLGGLLLVIILAVDYLHGRARRIEKS